MGKQQVTAHHPFGSGPFGMGSLPVACLNGNFVLRCLHLMAAGIFTYPRSFDYHACYGVVCAFLQLGCDPNCFVSMGRKGFGFLQGINSPHQDSVPWPTGVTRRTVVFFV